MGWVMGRDVEGQKVMNQVMNQRNLEGLVRSMQMSLGKLNVLIAVCDHPGYRDAVIQAYEESLEDLKITCCRCTIDRVHPNLKGTLLDLYAQQPKPLAPTVVTVVGADELLGVRVGAAQSPQDEFFFSAQWSKEGLITVGVPIVLWVSSQVVTRFPRGAEDFWSLREGVFIFERPLELGESESGLRELEEAIEFCEREIQGQEIQGQETDEYARLLEELAGLYEASDRFELAVPLYERALAIYRTKLGDRHADTVAGLKNLAGLYEVTERYELALPLYQQALESCRMEWGEVHLETAASLNSLAYLYRLMGEYELALPLYEKALGIRRAKLGDRHEATATSLNNLAGLWLAMGKYEVAVPLYEKAMEMFERVLGWDHPKTAVVRGNLRSLRERVGK